MVMASGCVCGPPPEDFDSPRASLDASVDQRVTPDASVQDVDAGTNDAGVVDAGSPNVPDIEVSASAFVDLGDLAYFPGGNPPAAAVTRLVVRNVGRAPLFLREPAAGSAGPPSWRITPLSGGRIEQLCAGRFDEASQSCTGELRGYDVNAGLAPGEEVELPLRITADGLGVYEFLFELFSNDPDELVTSRRLRINAVSVPPCDVEVSPLGIDFGLLGPGETLVQPVTIRNRLTGPNDVCLISNVEVSNAAVFELVETPRMLRLDPGATKQLKVRARAPLSVPPTPVAAAAELQFSLANPLVGIRRLPVVVTFGQSCLRFSPSTWNFGTTMVGCSSPEQSFDLINQCVTPLSLIRASSALPPFLSTQRFGTRDQLAPGAVLEDAVRVRHRPLVVAPLLGSLRVEVMQGGVATTYVAALLGEGVTDALAVEQMPSTSGKVDLLLVIDNSDSMQDKEVALRQSLPSLLEHAKARNLDFRLGVASDQDAALMRRLPNGTRWIEPSTPMIDSAFMELAAVGSMGFMEICSYGVLGTFMPTNLAPSRNGGFLRDDALLSVVCISDADDFGPVDRRLAQLWGIKGPQRRSSYRHTVMAPFGPQQPGCIQEAEPNGVNAALVDATGGGREEICTNDWSGAIKRLATTAFERRGDYDLLGSPSLSAPIRVFVDGTEWPQTSSGTPQLTLWTYDVVMNRVTFNPLAQPSPGSTIKVEYERICLQ